MGVMNYVTERLLKYSAAQTNKDDIQTQVKEESRNVLALYISEGVKLTDITHESFIGDVLLNPTKDIWRFSVTKGSEFKEIIDKTFENVLNGIDDLTNLNPKYCHSRDSIKKLVEKSNSKKKY